MNIDEARIAVGRGGILTAISERDRLVSLILGFVQGQKNFRQFGIWVSWWSKD